MGSKLFMAPDRKPFMAPDGKPFMAPGNQYLSDHCAIPSIVRKCMLPLADRLKSAMPSAFSVLPLALAPCG